MAQPAGLDTIGAQVCASLRSRVDTPTGHRDAAWLAMHAERLPWGRMIDLRSLHYMVIGERRPDGAPYRNSEDDWTWLREKAAKAARWLGYLPCEQITDGRQEKWIVRIFERHEPGPSGSSARGVPREVPMPDAHGLGSLIASERFRGIRPCRLVIVGEKASLEAVLAPLADRYKADLYLASAADVDPLIHQIAKTGAEEGRQMIIFSLSDCDPAGWQMVASLRRKLEALRTLQFPELQFELRPIALTPPQVREYGLPPTPLKDREKRSDIWKQAIGVDQTEIDALAALRPDLLGQIVREALEPFFDSSLARERVRKEAALTGSAATGHLAVNLRLSPIAPAHGGRVRAAWMAPPERDMTSRP